jgi:hypothetical protein
MNGYQYASVSKRLGLVLFLNPIIPVGDECTISTIVIMYETNVQDDESF